MIRRVEYNLVNEKINGSCYELRNQTKAHRFVSTSLQGYIEASYADLVKVFGHPQCTETSGDGKVDIEWELTNH